MISFCPNRPVSSHKDEEHLTKGMGDQHTQEDDLSVALAAAQQSATVQTADQSSKDFGILKSQNGPLSLVAMMRRLPSIKTDMYQEQIEDNITSNLPQHSLIVMSEKQQRLRRRSIITNRIVLPQSDSCTDDGQTKTIDEILVRVSAMELDDQGRTANREARPPSVGSSTESTCLEEEILLDDSDHVPRFGRESESNQGRRRFVDSRNDAQQPIIIPSTNKSHSHKHQNTSHNNTMSSQYHLEYTNAPPSPRTVEGFLLPRRSRSIAIKQNKESPPSEDYASSKDEESSEKMYDWATWQMYNRIVDHRRTSNSCQKGLTVPSLQAKAFGNTRSSTNAYDSSSKMDRLSPDCLHDGEVFQLEL